MVGLGYGGDKGPCQEWQEAHQVSVDPGQSTAVLVLPLSVGKLSSNVLLLECISERNFAFEIMFSGW